MKQLTKTQGQIFENREVLSKLSHYEVEVMEGRLGSFAAAAELLNIYKNNI
jgi:hypothetical protein